MQWLLECHIFCIILTATNSGRGRHSRFFVQGLGLALLVAAKTCPHRPQAFKRSIMLSRLRRRKTIYPPPFFLSEPVAGTPRHFVNVSRKYSMVLTAQNQYQVIFYPQSWFLATLSDYYVTTQITHVFRTKLLMSTPFFGDKTLKFGARVLLAPIQLLMIFFLFFAGDLDLLRPIFPPPNLK